jgi:cell wall-associated NlpC family hydrolase
LSPNGKKFWFRTPATPAMTAGHLRAPARFLLVAAVLVVASVGLARPAPASASAATVPGVSAALEANVWNYAIHQRGKPYEWGGTGPRGFDCSGLVYAAYRSRGLILPRTTYGMLASRHLVRIRAAQARPGDLAFYGSGHVELFDRANWSYGAARSGTRIGFHHMSPWWHATMYFAVRR